MPLSVITVGVLVDDKIHTFVTGEHMAEISINKEDWDLLKIKLKRKYRDLSDEDLSFEPGQEEELITRLMERLKRNREYVVFTIKKSLVNLDNNRV
jgi:hypothetical protein